MTSDNRPETQNEPEALCHNSNIPLWLVLLDNIPTAVLMVFGALIITRLSTWGMIGYLIYSLVSIIWFWAKICPYCHHYGTLACPCGYGVISAKLFKKRDAGLFKQTFKRNIGIMFPVWFVPAAAAIFLLISTYSRDLMLLTAVFSVTGFIIIPIISKAVGCRNCEIKDDCPWMQKKGSAAHG
ncbi:hypothetical protein JXO52_09260 [bacterium]|nr:hypothetical protein [bacterium]